MNRFTRLSVSIALAALSLIAFAQNASDPAARAEIRRLRDRVDSLAKRAESPVEPKRDEATISRVSALEAQLAQRGAQPMTPEWAKWVLPLLLGAGVAYLVARAASGSGPVQVPEVAPVPASSPCPDGRRLELLSMMRSRLDDLETSTRRHAGLYPLMTALQSSPTAPLHRIAELSAKEQEGMIRIQTAAGEIRSLAYEYGEVPSSEHDLTSPDQMGEWMSFWWQRLEQGLAPAVRDGSPQEPLDPLFREAREKLSALIRHERIATR